MLQNHCTDRHQIRLKIFNRLPTNNDNKHEGTLSSTIYLLKPYQSNIQYNWKE